MTIMLAIGVSRMARRHAIIRRLPAVETLGSVTVICSDKTGTLTQNQMTVQAVYAGGSHYEVTGAGYAPEGRLVRPDGATASPPAPLLECLRAGLLCNDSTVTQEEGVWKVHGDPTEAALIVAAGKAGLQRKNEEAARPRRDTIPFESQHQFMATLHEGGDGRDHVMTGQELARLSDAELIDAAQRCHVFARVSPEQKLRLVQALQAQGQIVAMTGDGVNDAPALRRADIGVAMALSGTEVAREAADMVLTDDNFASIEAAVEEGRAAFETLSKFIVWTLPTNGGQSLALLLAVVAGMPLPLQPVQLLWINMTTAICLGLMLAFEPSEAGLMRRPPRDARRSLLAGGLLARITLVSVLLSAAAFGLFEWELALGATEPQAWTVVTAMFIVGQAFYLLNCRSLTRSLRAVGWFSNPWIWAGMVAMLVLQLAFTYLPFMNVAFHSAPIGVDSWLRVLGAGVIVYAAVGVEKWVHARRQRADGCDP